MRCYETALTEDVLNQLIAFSADWEQENSCWGYVRNERSDIEGNRIFLAEEDGRVIGYLFGHACAAERAYAAMPDEGPRFEVEELYITPEKRSQGAGGQLFRFVEDQLRGEGVVYLLLSTAVKNFRAILHFYIDTQGMEFWAARLFKKL